MDGKVFGSVIAISLFAAIVVAVVHSKWCHCKKDEEHKCGCSSS